MTNGALLFYSIQPVRARVFSTRATRPVQSDSQRERGRTRVRACMGFVQFMSKWPSLTWHKQTNKYTKTRARAQVYAGTNTQTNNYGSRSTLTSFCELTGHLYTVEIKDIRGTYSYSHMSWLELARDCTTARYAAVFCSTQST